MSIYKEEKKRIGSARWVYVITIWSSFFLTLQTQLRDVRELERIGTGSLPIVYQAGTLFYGVIILICYLNNRLFYIKEQGKSVYLIRKYEIVPVSVGKLYRAKIRIMSETIAVMLLGSLMVYFFTVIANKYAAVAPNLWEPIVFLTVFAFAFMGCILLGLDGYHEYRRRRR